MIDALELFKQRGKGLTFTSKVPKKDVLQFLDLSLQFQKGHVCWSYLPQSVKPLLSFHSCSFHSLQFPQPGSPGPLRHTGVLSNNHQLHMQEKYVTMCLEYNALQEKVTALEKELEDLRAKGSFGDGDAAPWGYAKIAGNSNKVTYYTGLPNEETFRWVVSLYKNSCCSVETVSHEDQVLLVLMRLRLDIHLCFLADLFRISRNCASKIFESSLTTLVSELKGLVVWPDEEPFYAWQPKIFK